MKYLSKKILVAVFGIVNLRSVQLNIGKVILFHFYIKNAYIYLFI